MGGSKDEMMAVIMEKYGNNLYRTCLIYLADADQAEDAVQETFIRYLKKAPAFTDQEHEQAWLYRVATNICRDMLRFRSRRRTLNIEDIEEAGVVDQPRLGVLDLVMTLPQKHKEVMLMHYVEGYKVKEVASLLGASEAAVKKRLQYAREQLKLELEREEER